jgi:hypothetical protein
MANGPHSSDIVQTYILQAMRSTASQQDFEDVIDLSHSHDGEIEWSIGEVFHDSVLKEFDNGESWGESFDTPDYGLKALDQIYGLLDTTSEGNKRLEGLRALDIGWDFPVDGRTKRDWIRNYRTAGLVDDDEEVTPEGRIFLETDPRDYELEGIGVEDVGEVYRDLNTRKLSGDEPTGQRLEAIFFYGGGMDHTEVSDATGMAYRTTKKTAYDLRDAGVLTDSYILTPEGYEFANMVMDQLDRLEEATENRVERQLDGDWSTFEEGSFEGNDYMARAITQGHSD